MLWVLLGLKQFRLNQLGLFLWLKWSLLAWISSARLVFPETNLKKTREKKTDSCVSWQGHVSHNELDALYLYHIHNNQNNCRTSADTSQKILWNKVTPLQSPHKPIFITHFCNISYSTVLRSVMQTHISDSHCYLTITDGSYSENEGDTNSRSRLLYSQQYKCTYIMLVYETVLQCHFLAQRQTDYAISSSFNACRYKNCTSSLKLSQAVQSQDSSFCVGGELDVKKNYVWLTVVACVLASINNCISGQQ